MPKKASPPPLPSPAELLDTLPEALRADVALQWEEFLEAARDQDVEPPTHPEFLRAMFRVWAGSDFVARHCIEEPHLLQRLLDSGDLLAEYGADEYVYKLHAGLREVRNDEALAEVLRTIRNYEMVRIAWRDLAGWADLNETTRDVSNLAEACVDAALYRIHEWQCAELGTPFGVDGEPQAMVVIGMGKLGAWELNFSSDIDLIFAFPSEGETRGRRTALSNDEYFIQLGRRLIRALDVMSEHGFVFRVDMRLRPFGDSGPLVVTFDAMEDYYQTHGREWERYAMIKARVIAGDREAGAVLMGALKPFIYRRYLDFGAFESLRDMKEMIAREVVRKGLAHNIKLGPGGIREIEFIGQAFQLIRGGREPALQARPIQTVLRRLAELDYLPGFVTEELLSAYTFLRDTEHCLQMYQDAQTHLLPEDDMGRLRLAHAMGFEDWGAFDAKLRRHRQRVHDHFQQVFAAPQAAHAESDALDLTGIWQGTVDASQAEHTLGEAGYDDPEEALRFLNELRQSYSYRALTPAGRERMDRLMPLVMGAVGGTDNATDVLHRIIELLETVARRTAYLALLVENPVALSQLVQLCAASTWITALLADHPVLMDELLDPRTLYTPVEGPELELELRERLSRVDVDDLEQQMEALRQFKQAYTLRVAAADVNADMPLMKVSDHLTDIAEAVLQEVLRLAWQHLVARHGRPRTGAKGGTGFAVVAYGKLGGIELGYGSDLDLVFIYDGDEEGHTDGARPVQNAVFYARLGQRIIHILNTFTPSGILYEVDMRLRPSGASGLLVSSLEAFAAYEREEAWTWEHQALVRARVVAGDDALADRFAEVRREILSRPRDAADLCKEVREMRGRMREQLASKEAGTFDLKQGSGGITDIEFMVQYGVLRWAGEYPELLEWTDNIRLLETLAATGLMKPEMAALLADAYRAYRATVHRLTLREAPARVPDDQFEDYRAGVAQAWESWLGDGQ